ncbi:MAG TPA: two-component regulator propeller domain-containing protein [Chiayiivirga sp.]|mgnify:CR=1 FL=1|nr:two-component regulator propeller domain-containing protein [Chiayiivirga sp.]
MWAATDMGLWQVDTSSFESRLVGSESATLTALAIDARGSVWAAAESWLARADDGRYEWAEQPPELRDINQVSVEGDELLIASGVDLFGYRLDTATWRRWNIGPVQRLSPIADGHSLASLRDGRILQLSRAEDPALVTNLELMRPFNILRDRDASLWITTAAEGLFRLRQPWIGTLNDPEWRMAAPGRAIVPDGNGGYWFAFNCDGLRHWRADGTLEDWSDQLSPNWHCVETLHLGPRGTLWLGSSGGGVMRMDAATGAMPREIDRWRGQLPVHAIHENSDGSLLVAVRRETHRLAFRADGSANDTTLPALDGLIVRQIVPSRRGGLWFVGDHGALRIKDEVVQERWTQEQGLSSRFARALHESADGTLWIGTYGGGLNRIRIRLSGLSEAWTAADGSRSIVYPNLPWGDYLFQVQARREGEGWPEQWADLPISHPAPWYQRPWIWLVSTLLALVLLLDTGRQRARDAGSAGGAGFRDAAAPGAPPGAAARSLHECRARPCPSARRRHWRPHPGGRRCAPRAPERPAPIPAPRPGRSGPARRASGREPRKKAESPRTRAKNRR